MYLENQRLNADIKDMKAQIQQIKDEINSQYIRSPWIIEISGIPVKKDKNVYNINKIVDLVEIEDFILFYTKLTFSQDINMPFCSNHYYFQ